MSINLGTLAEDGTRTITKAQLLAGFPGLGQPASIISYFIQTGAGSLSNNGNGSWTYTAAQNDASAVEFFVSATDGLTTLSTIASLDLTPSQVVRKLIRQWIIENAGDRKLPDWLKAGIKAQESEK